MWIYYDTNNDVGSYTPGSPDAAQGNGYETLKWTKGYNPTDGLYGRVNSGDKSVVEFAVKKNSVIGNLIAWRFRAWAIKGNYATNKFDYHDSYNFQQAGSFPKYGNIYEIDNTPWRSFGQRYCIEGYKIDGLDGTGIGGWGIRLYDENGIEVDNTTTDTDGKYRFCDILAGSYRVCEEPRSGWTNLTSSCIDVLLEGSDVVGANFTNIRTSPVVVKGTIEVTKIVNWSSYPVNHDAEFEICIENDTWKSCKTIGPNGGVLVWEDLYPGPGLHR